MSQRPRVIFVTSVFDDAVNGPAVYAQYLWQAFQDDKEIDFHIVGPRGESSHANVHPVDATGREVMWAIQREALRLAAGSSQRAIVHGNSAYMLFLFHDYAGPWIAQVNDYEAATVWESPWSVIANRGPRRFLALAWRRRQEARTIARATRVICNSNYVRRIVSRYPSAEADRLGVIHKGIDVGAFRRATPSADATSSSTNQVRILFVGSDWQRKGLATLLDALPAVVERHPDCLLTIVGPIGREQRRIANIARRRGVFNLIHFAGRVERRDLPALMWNSDLFVLPTYAEAFGVAILEALAAGLPVVATNVGGIPEIVSSNEIGRLVRPSNPDELAAAINDVLDDQAYRAAIQTTGPTRAEEFSVDEMIAKVKQLYLQLASQS